MSNRVRHILSFRVPKDQSLIFRVLHVWPSVCPMFQTSFIDIIDMNWQIFGKQRSLSLEGNSFECFITSCHEHYQHGDLWGGTNNTAIHTGTLKFSLDEENAVSVLWGWLWVSSVLPDDSWRCIASTTKLPSVDTTSLNNHEYKPTVVPTGQFLPLSPFCTRH